MANHQFADPSEGLLSAIGALALNWAAIETALDFSVTMISHHYPYANMEKRVPQSLVRKIEYVSKGLQDPRLSTIETPGRRMLSDVRKHKSDRHKIVHGAILGAPDGDTIRSLRIRYTDAGHHVSIHTVTKEEVEGYCRAALPLADRATAFSIRLWNITWPNDVIDYPLGEFAA